MLADLACAIADCGYSTSAANLGDALDLYRSLGHRLGEAETLSNLCVLQRSTGDYTAAEASSRLAQEIFCDQGDRPYQAWVLNGLDMGQRLTGDYQAVAARHQRAFEPFRDLGNRLGQAEALNKLGELATRTQATSQVGDQHTQALAIARDLGARRGGSPRPGRHRQQPPPRRQPQLRRGVPAAGAGHLPAHRRPRRPARPGNPSNGTRCLPPPRSPDQSRPAAQAIHRPLPPRPKQAINRRRSADAPQPRVQPNNLICAGTGQKTPSTANMQ